MVDIIEWVYRNNTYESIKVKVLKIISKFVIKKHFSLLEEFYPNENHFIRKEILISLGQMGVKNNMYVIRKLADISDINEAIGFMESAGLLKENIDEEIEQIKLNHGENLDIMLEIVKYYYRLSNYDSGNNILLKIFNSGDNEKIIKAINFFYNEYVPAEIFKEMISMLSSESKKLVNTAYNFLQKRTDPAYFDFLVEYCNCL